MYNLRYHLASLVAVFLALALGLVLGGLVVGQGAMDSQQRAIVSGLQRDFKRLSDDNQRLTAEINLQRGFSSQMTDAWVKGRLTGKTIVVLTSGHTNEGLQSAITSIEQAGGTAAVVKFEKSGMGLSDKKTADAIRSIVGSSTDLGTSVAASLTAEWTSAAGARPVTDALVKAGVISLTGMKSSTVATQAVNIAAFSGKPDKVAMEIAKAYAAAGFYAVGAQTTTSGNSVAATAAAAKLSAFDTLGTAPGQFTLVALFSGGQQGYYTLGNEDGPKYPPVPSP
jgi:hypothetical protein